MCLDTLGKEKLNERISLFFCQTKGSNNQLFSLTNFGHLRKEEFCLAPKYKKSDDSLDTYYLYFLNCPSQKVQTYEWKYFEVSRTFVHLKSGFCLDISNSKSREFPKLAPCERDNDSQKWTFKKTLD